MDKDLKQMNHVKSYSCSSKKILALSFLTALQVSSCASGRRQGLIDTRSNPNGWIDLLPLSEGSFKFKEIQRSTVDVVLDNLSVKDQKSAFSQAVKKCDFPSVQSLAKNPSITSKEVRKALSFALKYEDTLSFRYKHEKIVHFLLTKCHLDAEDLCAQDEMGKSLLHLLIERGDIYGVQCLAEKLPVEALCAEDKKNKRPMHVAARYKSKKMFRILFDRIYALDQDRAIKELFKKDIKGYSVIESSYLRKDRNFAALLNNSHIQLPTFCRKGSEMFKFILNTVPYCLNVDQLVTIATTIEDLADGGSIYRGYAATLRSIVTSYIEVKYGSGAKEIIKYLAYKKHTSDIESEHGGGLKKHSDYVERRRRFIAYIEQKYRCASREISRDINHQERRVYIEKESDSGSDEGYLSQEETF